MIIHTTENNKIYNTIFQITEKTDIFLLIFYLLFFKSNFVVSSLILRTNPDEVPITNRSPTDFAPTLHRLCTDFGTEVERRIIGGRTEAIMSLQPTVEEKQDGLFVRCEDAQRHTFHLASHHEQQLSGILHQQ